MAPEMEYTFRSRIDAPADTVFDWHTRPGALERLTPGWNAMQVVERTGGVVDNGRTTLRINVGPFKRLWVAQHEGFDKKARVFRDQQVKGPFPKWVHTHSVVPSNSGGSLLEDRIEYIPPFGPLGGLINKFKITGDLDRLFQYRHSLVSMDVRRHVAMNAQPARIAITGATGLVGGALAAFLSTGGHRVSVLARPGRPIPQFLTDIPGSQIAWDPKQGRLDAAGLEGLDAVVHLAGENIAAKRWSAAQKEEIRRSRVASTKLLADAITKLKNPPRVLVCASAIGYYGDRRDEVLTEESEGGRDFLSTTCKEWEAAAAPAVARGVRVVWMRFGVILTPAGGALQKMLMPFLMGAGGRVGSGEQWMSWISHYDVIAALHFAIFNNKLSGPLNTVSPGAVTNHDFTKALGRVLKRPTIAPLPADIVRIVFGELGDALLLGSQRVVPSRLQEAGFEFAHPNLTSALRFELGRPEAGASNHP